MSNYVVRTRSLALGAPLIAAVLACAPGCLVLSLNPVYDADSIAWEPDLLGSWEDADDKASLAIERGEWRSYRLHYAHPVETGDLTGYLTAVGDDRYLDVMPIRGEDRGAFLIPVHGILRVGLQGDRLELTPLSYDWFVDRLRQGKVIAGLRVSMDQKDNALIVSPTAPLRSWLRGRESGSPAFGAGATFTRITSRKEG